MTIKLGTVIYSAVKPIFKIYFIIGCGFYMGKRNVLTVETARNVSDIVISLIYPCLIFDKIVSNINNSDIKQIGIIAFLAVIFYLMGALGAMIVFYTTKAPIFWRGGCFCVGLLPNISDLPIAYIQTLAGGLVFNVSQGNKGIAYICIYTAVQACFQFNLGAFKLIGNDFEVERKLKKSDEEKNMGSGAGNGASTPVGGPGSSSISQHSLPMIEETLENGSAPDSVVDEDEDPESDTDDSESIDSESRSIDQSLQPKLLSPRKSITSQYSQYSQHSQNMSNMQLRKVQSQNMENIIQEYSRADELQSKNTVVGPGNFTDLTTIPSNTNAAKKSHNKLMEAVIFFLSNLTRPMSISLIISITVAMIPWVQALFVVSTQTSLPSAPDGQPPLSFIMDFAGYLSNACVPLGLLLLGATLSRLQINEMPAGFWHTPLALSFLRLIILPIIGVAIVTRLKVYNWFENDNILFFICALVWGLPNATSLIYLTAFYTPLDNQHHPQMDYLALSYIIEYVILVVSLPFLTTYIIKVSLGL